MATNGRRRTKGAGSIIHRKDGSWEFRREVDNARDFAQIG